MGIFHKKQGVNRKLGLLFTSKREKSAAGNRRHSNGFYHKYFRGYTEVRQLNAKGRVVVERYYTQPWIVSGLSKEKYWLLRLLYIALLAASAIMYIIAMTQDVPGNYSIVVGLPGYASIMCLFFLVIATFSYVFVEKKMTIWAHTSSTKKLKRFSIATSIGQLVTAIALAVYAMITQAAVSKSLFCAAAALLSGVFSGAMFLIERKIPYVEQPNDMKLPAGEHRQIW